MAAGKKKAGAKARRAKGKSSAKGKASASAKAKAKKLLDNASPWTLLFATYVQQAGKVWDVHLATHKASYRTYTPQIEKSLGPTFTLRRKTTAVVSERRHLIGNER